MAVEIGQMRTRESTRLTHIGLAHAADKGASAGQMTSDEGELLFRHNADLVAVHVANNDGYVQRP